MAKKDKNTPVMTTILGPTATGKTRLAASVAHALGGEVISADSRQVYRGMDLGTGKDYEDYIIDGQKIPYHLVDIVDPGYEYNVFEFQQDFLKAFFDISMRNKVPVLCGGTGMYIEAVLSGYKLEKVPEDKLLRAELIGKDHDELIKILKGMRDIHNTTDLTNQERTIRAIEIEKHRQQHPEMDSNYPKINNLIFGIQLDRKIVRERITARLRQRLESGMIEEVSGLLSKGLKPGQLTFYGLEYRYITDHLTGKISYDEMFGLLNTAIHQFAKRQMTWFRRMEKKGFKIIWIDGELALDKKVDIIKNNYWEMLKS